MVTPAELHGHRAVLVHRHRRYRGGRRQPAGAQGLAPPGGRRRRRAIRRGVLGRGVSDRRDEGLRVALLAAVQGRDQAGLRDSGQSRLVRRARGIRRHVLRAGRRPRSRCAPASRPTAACRARPTRESRSSSGARTSSGGSTAFRPARRHAPFFQLQTPSFALFAVDTGVLRGVDRRADDVASRRARGVARQDGDGGARPSVLRRRP